MKTQTLLYKKCSHCKQIKPITEYYESNHSSSKDGYRFEYKQCDKAINLKSTNRKKLREAGKYKKMGSLYKLNKGLIYKAIHGTKYVTYICLECGQQHTTTWKLAHEVKFRCPSREYRKLSKTIPVLYTHTPLTKKCNGVIKHASNKRRGRKKLSLWKRILRFFKH